MAEVPKAVADELLTAIAAQDGEIVNIAAVGSKNKF